MAKLSCEIFRKKANEWKTSIEWLLFMHFHLVQVFSHFCVSSCQISCSLAAFFFRLAVAQRTNWIVFYREVWKVLQVKWKEIYIESCRNCCEELFNSLFHLKSFAIGMLTTFLSFTMLAAHFSLAISLKNQFASLKMRKLQLRHIQPAE